MNYGFDPVLILGVVEPLSHLEILLRLALAAVLGAVIGWERRRSEKPADIRTMVLISVGAAAFVAIGVQLVADHPTGETIRIDPSRVLAYVISGVGFLGAGAILHSKRAVTGLTTASAIWAVAAMGAACGLGEFWIAYIVFAIVLLALWTPWIHSGFKGGLENGNGYTNGNGNGRERDEQHPVAQAD